MNIKTYVPLIAGLCIGGFALKIGLNTLKKARGAQPETVQIWAARADIPRGVAITKEMLKPLNYPAPLVPEGAFRDVDQLVGRVPRLEAPAGLPVLEGMLSPPGTPVGVIVPPGFRAVAVKIDESSGVDYHLEPGCRVDVVGYFQIQERGKRETIARTIIENVEVAAVGQRVSVVEEDVTGKDSRSARAVTLLVKPTDVPILHLAEQRGKIKLSMRPTEETEPEPDLADAEPVNFDELLRLGLPESGSPQSQPAGQETGQGNRSGLGGWLRGLFASAPKTEPAPPPPAPPVVEPAEPEPPQPWVVAVYRGQKLEEVKFVGPNSRERAEDTEADTSRRTFRSASGVRRSSGSRTTSRAVPVTVPVPATTPQPAHDETDPDSQDQEPQEPQE